ncbi:MAG: shikimate dehydrogenase [Acidimicrobiia bacterium]|nr:shikimate dehydrogenase [Acidimicrobiia bacterium]
MTAAYAVIGDPVAHSLSPAIHQAAFDELGIDAGYTAIRVDAAGLPAILDDLRTGRFSGVNVTMPHKHRAFELADRVEGDAMRAEAVNTLVHVDGAVVGLSTDIPAIRQVWSRRNLPTGSVLILGAGGAAAAALVALGEREIFISARSKSRLAGLLDRLAVPATIVPWATSVPGAVVVNATPLGMHNETLPTGLVAQSDGVFDMAYGLLPTPAVIAARTLGLPAADGLDMLVAQAALSFEAWSGRPAPFDVMLRAAQIAQGW